MTKKKWVNLFLSFLMLFSVFGSISVPETVEAEGTAVLSNDAIINKMFSNLQSLTGSTGYASLKTITVDGVTWEVFCADPGVRTQNGANYTLEKHPDFYTLPAELQSAGKVLLNWYLNHNGEILQGSSAEYYAVQLAMWGAQKGNDPAILTPIDPNNVTAVKIKNMASTLYNESLSWAYPTESVSYNGSGKTYDYSDVSGTQAVYQFPGSDQYYFRSELLGVTVNGLTEHLSYNVSLSDNSIGIKITDAHNNEASSFGYGTNHGTGFYIYTPINRLNEAKSVTVNVSNVMYTKLGIALWNATNSQRLINRYSYLEEGGSFNTTVKLPEKKATPTPTPGPEPTPEPTIVTGEITIHKKGTQPNSVSTSKVNGETLYTISWAEKPLKNAAFSIERKRFDSEEYINITPSETAIRTGYDGKIGFKGIAIDSEQITTIRITEQSVPNGYVAIKDDTMGEFSDGMLFQKFNFDPSKAVDGVVKKNDFTFSNTPKHLSIEITKNDSKTGTPLDGAKFGLYSTDEIKTYDGTIIPANSLLEVGTTSNGGKLTFGNSVPVTQNYVVKELEAPAGYEKEVGIFEIDTAEFIRNKEETNVYKLNITNDPVVIEIGTSAMFKDGSQEQSASSSMEIIDYVSHSGLTEGKTYRLETWLMDKKTGEEFKVNGETVRVSGDVVAKKDTPFERSISFDGSKITETTDLVVYEELYDGNNKIAEHKEIDDGDQTVKVIKEKEITIKTTAKNKMDDTKVIKNIKNTTIVDTVSYENLTPGKNYILKGTLFNKTTGDYFKVDGKPLEVTQPFTPASENGSELMEFTFDASGLKKTDVLVVYEDLYDGETLLKEHHNPNDTDQTVTIEELKIGTSATVNGIREVESGKVVTIDDEVSYENLYPEKEYELKGYLVDESGKEILIDGKSVSKTTKFTPSSPTGKEVVSISLDTSKIDKNKVVVFEELYLNGELIAEHKDTTDSNQTITIKKEKPEVEIKIGTTANISGNKEATIGGKITISDNVKYEGVVPGTKYQLKGYLMNKDGTPFKVEGKEVSKTTAFIPEKESGTEVIDITFDSKGMSTTELVVFEELLLDGKIVAKHTDLSSTDQTVKLIKPVTGRIQITKYDVTATPKVVMEGVQFAIHSTDGSISKQAKTGKDGVVVFDNLDISKEYFIEETVPAKYVLVTELKNISFKDVVEKDGIKTVALEVDNKKVDERTGILIKKIDSETKEGLGGAEFILFDTDKKEVTRGTTDNNGILEFKDIPLGTYTLAEVSLPKGYMYHNNVSSWKITLRNAEKTMEANLQNDPFKATFELIKKDYSVQTKVVPGATYGLYDTATNKLIEEKVTDSNGKIVFDNKGEGFKYGSAYYVKETKAAEGYELDTAQYDYIVNNSSTNHQKNSVLSKTVYDKLITKSEYGKLRIVKVDKDDSSKRLSDATFGIYEATDTSYSKPIQTVKTGSDGTVLVEKLALGEYLVKEITAPSGYSLNTSAFKVRIATVHESSPLELKVTNQKDTDPTGTLRIQKYIEGTNTPLKGAEFTLYSNYNKTTVAQKIKDGYTFKDNKWYKPNGEIASNEEMGIGNSMDKVIATGTTDEKGIIEFKDLIPTQYTLKETKVPSGYKAKTEQTTINLSGKQSSFREEIIVYNIPNKGSSNNGTIKTGELGKNPWFYGGLLCGGVILIGGVLYIRKKNGGVK